LQGFAVAGTTPGTDEVLKWNGTAWAPAADDTTALTAGTGIAIGANNTITNTGDTDGSDDINTGDAAGGDLSGTYPAPTVDGLQGFPVANLAPSAGQVLYWNGTQWAPFTLNVDDADADPNNEIQTLNISGTVLSLTNGGGSVNIPTNTYTGGDGIAISGQTIINIGDTDSTNDITNTTVAGGDLSGTYPNPTVDALQGNAIAATAPASTEVLKWNGTAWAPSADSVNDADADSTNEIQSLTLLGNQLILSDADTVTLPLVGASYGAGTGIAIDGSNIISNIGDTDSTNDITNTTVAGGDLSGTYPDPTVAALQGSAVSAVPPVADDVLKWDGSQWLPTQDTDSDSTNELQSLSISGINLSISDGNTVALPYFGGAGIALSGAQIINIGDTDASDDVNIGDAAGGDLSGTYPNPMVASLQGNPVSSGAPTTNDVLKWNGTQWAPATDDTTLLTAGTGITIGANNTITNTGDTDGSDDINTGDAAGGDLSGTYPNPTVGALQGFT
ncbi:MAG: hypothetical protein D6722_19350, partial [Bacteroidetes bacterium]